MDPYKYGLNKAVSRPVPVGSGIRLHQSITHVRHAPRGGVRMHRAFSFALEGPARPTCAAESLTHFHP
ncbi:hypothetical protein [Streptomyces sp. NPDC056291]|uniref:hypothetical protein n=1 Tax=Streptomyces sp. NPDC056291 TaxID=3345772 RepID=UPI0035D81983